MHERYTEVGLAKINVNAKKKSANCKTFESSYQLKIACSKHLFLILPSMT